MNLLLSFLNSNWISFLGFVHTYAHTRWTQLALALACGWLYLLPLWVAIFRRHKQAVAIFAITALTAWTGIGWLIALVWALIGSTKAREQSK